MPRRWNVHHSPIVLDNHKPAVWPGQPYDFTDEQIAEGLSEWWSEEDPRAGLAQERAFRARRRAEAARLAEESNSEN